MPLPLFARNRPVVVTPFAGFRNEKRLHLTARVLREPPRPPEEAGSMRKFLYLLNLYASHEIAGERVRLTGKSIEAEAVSDSEGFVHFDLALPSPRALPKHSRWERLEIALPHRTGTEAEAHILAPGTDGRLAVISDIDDTIIETGAHAFLRNWRRVLVELPHDRLATPGVGDLYAHLGGGHGLDGPRPGKRSAKRAFFYVSSSPWNLYGFLARFMELNRLPHGPMLLRNWGFNRATLGRKSHGAHKDEAIARILGFYDDHRFVLIGDDTQRDIHAFAAAVQRFPGRIAAIFIRTATGKPLDPVKEEAIAAMQRAGVPVRSGNGFEEGHDLLAGLGIRTSGKFGRLVAAGEAPPESDDGA